MDKKDYRASALAKFLHSFPHVDLTFQSVNSTFNLANRAYKEVSLYLQILNETTFFQAGATSASKSLTNVDKERDSSIMIQIIPKVTSFSRLFLVTNYKANYPPSKYEIRSLFVNPAYK